MFRKKIIKLNYGLLEFLYYLVASGRIDKIIHRYPELCDCAFGLIESGTNVFASGLSKDKKGHKPEIHCSSSRERNDLQLGRLLKIVLSQSTQDL